MIRSLTALSFLVCASGLMAQDCEEIANLKKAKTIVNVKATCTMGGITATLFEVPSKPDMSRCIVLESTCDAITGWVNCAYGEMKLNQACRDGGGTTGGGGGGGSTCATAGVEYLGDVYCCDNPSSPEERNVCQLLLLTE